MIISVVIALTNPMANQTRLKWATTIFQKPINNTLAVLAKALDFIVWLHIDKCLAPIMRGILNLMNKLAKKPVWYHVIFEFMLIIPILTLGLLHSPLIAWKRYRERTRQDLTSGNNIVCYSPLRIGEVVNWKQEGF